MLGHHVWWFYLWGCYVLLNVPRQWIHMRRVVDLRRNTHHMSRVVDLRRNIHLRAGSDVPRGANLHSVFLPLSIRFRRRWISHGARLECHD